MSLKKRKEEHKMLKFFFKFDLSFFSTSFGSEKQCIHLADRKLAPGGLMKGNSTVV